MPLTEAVGRLTAAFERIAATRMAGLPMNNPALRVAAVGFRPWREVHRLGVLVTPWAINLVLLGDPAGGALRLAADCRQTWDFPSGSYDFMGGAEPECGAFQFCSLFSPVFEFPDQAFAEATAGEIMAALLVAAPAPAAARCEPARRGDSTLLQAPTSRRDFLRGRVGGLPA